MTARKRKRARKFFIILTGLVFLSLLFLGFLLLSAAKPPLDIIGQCQTDLSHARKVQAHEYAREILSDAEYTWQKAMIEWQIQNDRLFFMRNYEGVTKLAFDASSKAKRAAEKSMQVKDSLQRDLSSSLKFVDNKIKNFEANYASLPMEKAVRNSFTSAKLLYLEALHAYERGDYQQVPGNLEKAKFLVSQSVQKAHSTLNSYFNNYSKWRRWADETVNWSKTNNSAAIVVDKFARECLIYKDGKLKQKFDIELGPNWMSDKLYRGDKATPEGRYHITKKKSHRDTKYYKALLINFPNDEDKAEYATNVKKGRVSKRGLGSLIEIHGGGGRGIDWTDGCVALTNEDMDKIYDQAAVGTPVTIVGSLKTLQEINGL